MHDKIAHIHIYGKHILTTHLGIMFAKYFILINK